MVEVEFFGMHALIAPIQHDLWGKVSPVSVVSLEEVVVLEEQMVMDDQMEEVWDEVKMMYIKLVT